MPSLVDRVNEHGTQKSSLPPAEYYLPLTGDRVRNRDIPFGEHGYAQAYSVIEGVRNSIDVYADLIEATASQITCQGKTVATSTDEVDKHPLYKAMSAYRRKHNIDLLRRIVYSVMIYDEAYIWLQKNDWDFVTGLSWLNPLGVTIDDTQGFISGYRFMWGNTGMYRTFKPSEIAYDHGFNPYDDHRGDSIVTTAIHNVNISRNMKRFLRDFFVNNARPGFVASYKDATYSTNKDAQAYLEKMFRDFLKGDGNQHRTLISNIPLDMVAFEQPDIGKQYVMHADVRKEIYASFGVPLAIVGDTSTTRYKETLDARASFVELRVKPLLLRLQDFINDRILPALPDGDGHRIEFDTTPFEMLTEADQQQAQMIREDMGSGIITIGQAQELRKYDVDEELKDILVVKGRPMTKAIFLQLANTIPSQEVLDYAQAETEEVTQDAIEDDAEGSDPPEEVVPAIDPLKDESEEKAHEVVADDMSVTPVTLPHSKLFEGLTELYPEEGELESRQRDELKAWYQLVKRGKSRPFESDVLEPYIRHAVIDRLDEVKTDHPQAKSIAILDVFDDEGIKTVASYRRQARSLFRRFARKDMGITDFIAGMSALIDQQFSQAFKRGVKRGGKTWKELTGEEQARLSLVISDEKFHLFKLATDIHDGGTVSSASLRNRVERWLSRYDRIEGQGYLVAKANTKIKRKMDPRKENCRDCRLLNGRVYLASTWLENDAEPRSTAFECFGLFCGCTDEETDEPITKGAFPRLRGRG